MSGDVEGRRQAGEAGRQAEPIGVLQQHGKQQCVVTTEWKCARDCRREKCASGAEGVVDSSRCAVYLTVMVETLDKCWIKNPLHPRSMRARPQNSMFLTCPVQTAKFAALYAKVQYGMQVASALAIHCMIILFLANCVREDRDSEPHTLFP